MNSQILHLVLREGEAPACNAAIEAGREDHGLHKVARASQRVWVSQAQIVMYLTSAMISRSRQQG
jgi:hypothetical protein